MSDGIVIFADRFIDPTAAAMDGTIVHGLSNVRRSDQCGCPNWPPCPDDRCSLTHSEPREGTERIILAKWPEGGQGVPLALPEKQLDDGSYEVIYRKLTTVERDEIQRLSPVVESNAAGYYHWPAFWIGAAPNLQAAEIDLGELHVEMYRREMDCGVTVRALREGFVLFDFSGWAPGRAKPAIEHDKFDRLYSVMSRRAQFINCHLACLYTCLFRRQKECVTKMPVTPSTLISVQSIENDSGYGFGDMRQAHLASSRYRSTYARHTPATFDWRIQGRHPIIEEQTIDESLDLLAKIIGLQDDTSLDLVETFLFGCEAFENHNCGFSLVTSWTVAEKCLNRKWKDYLNANRDRVTHAAGERFINSERLDKLLGRDFTASIVSEVLSLADEIPHDLYKSLDRTRRARNDWMHELESISAQQAIDAKQLAE